MPSTKMGTTIMHVLPNKTQVKVQQAQ